MPPGSKKSSASSNSTGTMCNTAAVQVETAATTPASKILTSTPLTVASPSTRASATGVAKWRRVRGPTRGKRIRRIIVKNKGERISAYVTPEMRAFCGMNANKVVSELGTQIRWICPIQGFYPSWNNVDSTLKDAILQAVRVMMVEMRDAAALSGTPLSAEEISIKCLGESKTKTYIRGFGNGPKPSTYLSKSNSQSAHQDQVQKLQHELDLFRKEQRREREEEKMRREEEQKSKSNVRRNKDDVRRSERRRRGSGRRHKGDKMGSCLYF